MTSNRSGFGLDDIRENNRRAPQNSESTIWILKYWVKRAKFIRKIRSQIAGLLERMTNPYCNFCGINWGLRGETIENIEDIFLGFWRELLANEEKQKLIDNHSKAKRKYSRNSKPDNVKRVYETSDIIKWQQYFQKHATFRTICFECMNEVLEKKKHNSTPNENRNGVDINNTRNVIVVEEERTEQKNRNVQGEISKKLKEIVKVWLGLVRNSKKK